MALNALKLSEEVLGFFETWMDPPKAKHPGGSWVNRFVEASRAAPYAVGHIDAFVWPLFLVLLGIQIVRWI